MLGTAPALCPCCLGHPSPRDSEAGGVSELPVSPGHRLPTAKAPDGSQREQPAGLAAFSQGLEERSGESWAGFSGSVPRWQHPAGLVPVVLLAQPPAADLSTNSAQIRERKNRRQGSKAERTVRDQNGFAHARRSAVQPRCVEQQLSQGRRHSCCPPPISGSAWRGFLMQDQIKILGFTAPAVGACLPLCFQPPAG